MTKIKVVTLVDRIFGGGGGERVAANIVTRLDPDQFSRTLCVSRPSAPEMIREIRDAGVHVIELERARATDVRSWQPLLSHLRRERVDVLHTHKFGSNVWGAVAARLVSTPVFVTHEHSWSFSGDPRRRLLDRFLIAPRASAMIAVSAADARRMHEIEKIPTPKIKVIPNGIDSVPRDPQKLRRELGLGFDVPIVGFVGSLRPEKRVDVLLAAVSALHSAGASFRLVLIGDGPQRPALERQAQDAGVASITSFVGYRDDATELASGFDIGVLASEREGAPLALLEYMNLGLAIVATGVGGIPDIVDHGEHALLIQPNDAESLRAAVAQLLVSPEERRRLGLAAAARQSREFELSVVTRQIEGLYRSLVGRAPGRPEGASS